MLRRERGGGGEKVKLFELGIVVSHMSMCCGGENLSKEQKMLKVLWPESEQKTEEKKKVRFFLFDSGLRKVERNTRTCAS